MFEQMAREYLSAHLKKPTTHPLIIKLAAELAAEWRQAR